MSIELLSSEHTSAFKNSIKNTKDKVRIVSPFIGFETSKQLVNSLKGTGVKCTIVTRFYRGDFLNHASSLEGLKMLVEAGFKVYALQDLHTKLYIFDSEIAILGSANFTTGGFKNNIELSLLIEEESELIKRLSVYYDELMEKIKMTGDWLIKATQIEDEIEMVNKLTKNRKDDGIKCKNEIRFGATIEEQTEPKESDEIERILKEEINSDYKFGIWMKFVGTGDDRFETSEKFSPEKLKSNNKITTSFPRNPRGMEDKDKNGTATPMIIARARTKGFKIENNVSEEDLKQYKWMSNYPFYIEVYDVEVLNEEVGNGISLESLILELGSELYPSTQGEQLSVAKLKLRHHQKSHIRITPVAKNFIDKRFEDIAKKNGIIKY